MLHKFPTRGIGFNPSTFLYQGWSTYWENTNQTTTWTDDISKAYIMGIELEWQHDIVRPLLVNQTIHKLMSDLLDIQWPFGLCIHKYPKVQHLSADTFVQMKK